MRRCRRVNWVGVWPEDWPRGGFSVGLAAVEFLEGEAIVLVGGVDAALQAGELVGVLAVGLAEGDFVVGLEDGARAFLPKLGFDDAETAEEPFGVDEGVDEHALFGGGGAEAVVVFGFEDFEVGGSFAADDLGFGVDAGFQGIHT